MLQRVPLRGGHRRGAAGVCRRCVQRVDVLHGLGGAVQTLNL